MRLIHTADWHLGRVFHGVPLTDDQACALDGLIALARDVRPDAVVVSGDVYDRAVPPPEAVALLDETLTRLLEAAGRVVVIAGNHDGPERLAFGSRVLSHSGLHVAGPVSAKPAGVLLDAEGAPVRIWALPYADPPEVAHAFGDPELRGHEAAMRAMTVRVRERVRPGERNVAVAHAWVTGGAACGSERPLSVGGTGEVPADVFDGFDYVALGHLHRAQEVGEARVRYPGSLLKYSFDEWEHVKSVSVVELGGDGGVSVTEETLPIRRDVRRISGTLDELLAADPGKGREDYLWADLTDVEPRFNALERLRAVHPNILYAARLPSAATEGRVGGPSISEVRRLGTLELFSGFFREATGDELTRDQADVLASFAEGFERESRGA